MFKPKDNISAFIYRLFHEDVSSIIGTNAVFVLVEEIYGGTLSAPPVPSETGTKMCPRI